MLQGVWVKEIEGGGEREREKLRVLRSQYSLLLYGELLASNNAFRDPIAGNI